MQQHGGRSLRDRRSYPYHDTKAELEFNFVLLSTITTAGTVNVVQADLERIEYDCEKHIRNRF